MRRAVLSTPATRTVASKKVDDPPRLGSLILKEGITAIAAGAAAVRVGGPVAAAGIAAGLSCLTAVSVCVMAGVAGIAAAAVCVIAAPL